MTRFWRTPSFSSCSIARSGVGAPESFELSRTIPDKGIRIGPVVGYRVGAGAHPAAPWAGWDGPSHSLRLRPSICYPGHRAFRHRQAHFAALREVTMPESASRSDLGSFFSFPSGSWSETVGMESVPTEEASSLNGYQHPHA